MLNLNPFKKKDDGFSLDNYSLPTVKDQSQNQSSSFEQNPNNFDQSSLSQGNSFQNNFPSEQNSFTQQPNLSSQGFSSSQDFQQQPFNKQTSDPYIQQEVSRARLDSIEAKVTLIQSKINNIEDTLDKIYEMLSYEISDETKQKLNFKSLSSSARDKLENNR